MYIAGCYLYLIDGPEERLCVPSLETLLRWVRLPALIWVTGPGMLSLVRAWHTQMLKRAD